MASIGAEKLPAWLLTVILLTGITVIIIAVNKGCENDSLRDSGCKTTGKIIRIEKHAVEYDYNIEGKIYHGLLKTKAYDIAVGEVYTTYYDCNDKTKSFIALDEKVLK